MHKAGTSIFSRTADFLKGREGLHIFAKAKPLNQVLGLEIASIAPNPAQPRKQFEPAALKELADSIEQNGLLQPITVRKVEGGYELVAGERRLMACRMLQMERIPAIVEELTQEKSAIFALIENLQRRDLNYFEQAQGIQRLMQQCDLTQEQVAQKLGKAQSTIANKLRLLSFHEPLQRRMLDAGLTERHARALLKLQEDEEQVALALNYIIEERLNVGETERYVETLLTAEPERERPKMVGRLFMIKDVRIFINTLNKALSTMKTAGIEIDTQKEEDAEFIVYNMKIPKKGIYKVDEVRNQSTAG